MQTLRRKREEALQAVEDAAMSEDADDTLLQVNVTGDTSPAHHDEHPHRSRRRLSELASPLLPREQTTEPASHSGAALHLLQLGSADALVGATCRRAASALESVGASLESGSALSRRAIAVLSTAAPAIRRLLDAAESYNGAGASAGAEERQRRTVTRPISDFVASVLGDFDMGRVTVQFTRLNELANALIVSTFNRHSRPGTKASDVLYAVLYEHKFVVAACMINVTQVGANRVVGATCSHFCVAQCARRRGLGRLLAACIARRLRASPIAVLVMNDSDARGFWDRVGAKRRVNDAHGGIYLGGVELHQGTHALALVACERVENAIKKAFGDEAPRVPDGLKTLPGEASEAASQQAEPEAGEEPLLADHTVVWARVQGFPWWPGRVADGTLDGGQKVLVNFAFDAKPTNAKVSRKRVRRFPDEEIEKAARDFAATRFAKKSRTISLHSHDVALLDNAIAQANDACEE